MIIVLYYDHKTKKFVVLSLIQERTELLCWGGGGC